MTIEIDLTPEEATALLEYVTSQTPLGSTVVENALAKLRTALRGETVTELDNMTLAEFEKHMGHKFGEKRKR